MLSPLGPRTALGGLVVAVLATPLSGLDLTVGGIGLGLGNSPRIAGVRINAVDRDVERVVGLDLTLWNPAPSPHAHLTGIAAGLVGHKARRVDGLGVGAIAVTAADDINGVGLGGFGVGARQMHGVAGGLVLIDAEEDLTGLGVAGYRARIRRRLTGGAVAVGRIDAGKATGMVLAGVGASTDSLRGLAIGGIGAGGEGPAIGILFGGVGAGTGGDLTGAVLAGVGAGCGRSGRGVVAAGIGAGVGERFTGVVLGGVGAGVGESGRGVLIAGLGAGAGDDFTGIVIGGLGAAVGKNGRGVLIGGLGAGAGETFTGLALAGVGAGAGERLEGLAIGLGGVGTDDRIDGVALGGLVCIAPRVRGVATGALNGVVIEGIDLEEFLEIRRVNERFVGLSIGLVNYSAELRGVQVGLLNYAGNNPRWARLLPLLNAHLGG